jgi:hypothetical protein
MQSFFNKFLRNWWNFSTRFYCFEIMRKNTDFPTPSGDIKLPHDCLFLVYKANENEVKYYCMSTSGSLKQIVENQLNCKLIQVKNINDILPAFNAKLYKGMIDLRGGTNLSFGKKYDSIDALFSFTSDELDNGDFLIVKSRALNFWERKTWNKFTNINRPRYVREAHPTEKNNAQMINIYSNTNNLFCPVSTELDMKFVTHKPKFMILFFMLLIVGINAFLGVLNVTFLSAIVCAFGSYLEICKALNLRDYIMFSKIKTALRPQQKNIKPENDYNDQAKIRLVKKYPFGKQNFVLNPADFIYNFIPKIGTIISENIIAPSELLQDVGMPVAFDDNGNIIHIPFDSSNRTNGVLVLGQPGSGKSIVINDFYGYCLKQKRDNGEFNSLIRIESKDEQSLVAHNKWADLYKQKLFVIDVLDATGLSINFFQKDRSPQENARIISSAIKYAFANESAGDTVFEQRSQPNIASALTLAFYASSTMMNKLRIPKCSRIKMAHLLLGANGITLAKDIYKMIVKEHPELRNELYELNETQFKSRVESALNRLGQLELLEVFFTPQRKKVTFKQIIERGLNVYINTSTSSMGNTIDASLSRKLSSMLLFLLQDAIRQYANDYKKQGKFVTIFSDELSELSGSNSEILSWLHDEGRSYGVCPILATQRPNQLSKELKETVLDFGTKLIFKQSNFAVATELVDKLGLATKGVNAETITSLDASKYSVLLVSSLNGITLPPTICKSAGWEFKGGICND